MHCALSLKGEPSKIVLSEGFFLQFYDQKIQQFVMNQCCLSIYFCLIFLVWFQSISDLRYIFFCLKITTCFVINPFSVRNFWKAIIWRKKSYTSIPATITSTTAKIFTMFSVFVCWTRTISTNIRWSRNHIFGYRKA